MPYLGGLGQITDPQDPALQLAPPPPWIGTASQQRVQQITGQSVALLTALTRGTPPPDVTVAPDAPPADRAFLDYARSWLRVMSDAQIQAIYPLAPAPTLARARTLLAVPGLDPAVVRRDTIARFQKEIPELEGLAAQADAYVTELQRYQQWVNDLLAQFQTYLQWQVHHEKKKAHRAANLSKALEVVADIAKYIPYVGWVITAAAIAANVGVQIKALKDAIRALKEAGERTVVLEQALNAYEGVQDAAPRVRNFLAEALLAIAIRESYLRRAGATVPPAIAGSPRRRMGGGRVALLVGGAAAAALALVAAVR